MPFKLTEKSAFFLRNFLRGLLWLTVIIIGFIFLKLQFSDQIESLFTSLHHRKFLIYLIFLISELAFGIIPPELFFIWATYTDTLLHFFTIIALLASISYLSGIAGYYFGRYLNTTRVFRHLTRRFLKKYIATLDKFGVYLLLVAALTPVPFSGICMVVGSASYPAKKFVVIILSRFVRFFLYATFIWEANLI